MESPGPSVIRSLKILTDSQKRKRRNQRYYREQKAKKLSGGTVIQDPTSDYGEAPAAGHFEDETEDIQEQQRASMVHAPVVDDYEVERRPPEEKSDESDDEAPIFIGRRKADLGKRRSKCSRRRQTTPQDLSQTISPASSPPGSPPVSAPGSPTGGRGLDWSDSEDQEWPPTPPPGPPSPRYPSDSSSDGDSDHGPARPQSNYNTGLVSVGG
jgi:hypothetical protein